MTDETKVGARNNRPDRERVRGIRQKAKEILETTMEIEPNDIDPPDIDPLEDDRHLMSIDDAVIAFGDEVKTWMSEDGRTHVGGYLVRFSDETTPDLTGDYFTKDTDFGIDEGDEQSIPVYFNHGQRMKSREGGDIVITRKIGKGRLSMDDQGLLIDAILYNRDEYDKAIASMVKSLGWSSGALSHLVDREYKGSGSVSWIKRWIIGEGSLTPTPAEPRNSAVPLKSLIEVPATTEEPTGEAEAIGEIAPSDGDEVKAVAPTINIPIQNEVKKMELTPEVMEIIEAASAKVLKAYTDSLPTNGNGGVEVAKDAGDQPWQNFGDYIEAVKFAGMGREVDKRLYQLKAPTGLGELVPADGGYLVPTTYAAGIAENVYNTGQILSRVSRLPVSGNRLILNAVDESSRVAGSRQGGILGYWLAEAGAKTGSHPTFRQVDLKLNKVAALVYATDELLSDTTALVAYLSRAVPNELRFMVEDAIIEGNGVGKPQGILTAGCLETITRDNAGAITYTDITNMWARRFVGYNDYVWLVNQDATPQLDRMVLASSTEVPLRFVDYGPDGVLRMKGRPVIETEYNATLGSVGDIILASLSQYQVIDKGGIEAASSIHVNFVNDEQVFRWVMRVDGAPLWNTDLTPFHGSNDVSPFVVLSSATT